jgi:hypothetical protein
MNDDELGQRLADELHARIHPPSFAPERLYEHMRDLSSMESIREPLSNRPHTLRNLFGFAAAIALVTLLGGGVLTWQAVRTGSTSPANGLEMFGRVDAKVAWAESGSDLYLTRDGGVNWTHSTLPGGMSLGQYEQAMYARKPSDAAPTPILGPGDAVPSTGPGDQGGAAPPGFPNHLYPVFIDADHGWLLSWTQSANAAGQSSGWILTSHRTTDGGQSWQSSQLPGTYDGYGLIQFIDPQHGWIEVYRMNSGSGSSQPTPVDGSASASPTVDTPASANTTILETSDGGASWSTVSTLASFAFVHFTSATEGWGWGQDQTNGHTMAFLRTTDGGRTWSQSVLPSQPGCSISGPPDAPVSISGSVVVHALCLPDGSNSSSPTSQIVTFTSADDGKSWTVDSSHPISGSTYLSGMTAVLYPLAGQPIPSIEYTTPGTTIGRLQATFDGGKTWIAYPTDGLPAAVTAAEWASPEDVWVLVSSSGPGGLPSGELYASHDAGNTWKALLGAPAWPASFQPLPTPMFISATLAPMASSPIPSRPMITSLGRIDANVAWVVSSDQSSGTLRITQDGGGTWSEPRAMPGYGDVQFIDASHGWVVEQLFDGAAQTTGQVVVFRTDDGGVNWLKGAIDVGNAPAASGGSMGSTRLHFRDALNGVLLESWVTYSSDGRAAPSASGAICEEFATSDGGATWSAPKATACMMSATFVDAGLGYAADPSLSPVLYVTEDGGRTWVSGDLPTPAGVGSNSQVFVDLMERRADGSLRAVVAWMGGSEPMVSVVSADGGRTWSISGKVSLATNSYRLVALSEGHWLALSAAVSLGSTAENASGMVTEDAGVTWKPIAAAGLPSMFTTLDFASATDGWAAAGTLACDSSVAVPSSGLGDSAKSACALGPQAIYATTDGGATWKVIFAP